MEKNGFTLIELLVIIAIIGILGTIILVTVNNAKLKADCKNGNVEACLELDNSEIGAEVIDNLIKEKRADNEPPIQKKTNLEVAREICGGMKNIERFEGDPESTWRKNFEVRCK